jgi:hypothetical protein
LTCWPDDPVTQETPGKPYNVQVRLETLVNTSHTYTFPAAPPPGDGRAVTFSSLVWHREDWTGALVAGEDGSGDESGRFRGVHSSEGDGEDPVVEFGEGGLVATRYATPVPP